MSPGSYPRPSLSGAAGTSDLRRGAIVSPGSYPRPSLSEHRRSGGATASLCVAGELSSAFVERSRCSRWHSRWARRVAGELSSAFVERPRVVELELGRAEVSPGSYPRPSLSALAATRPSSGSDVSPGSYPRPSLSVRRPLGERLDQTGVAGELSSAFVERRTRAVA